MARKVVAISPQLDFISFGTRAYPKPGKSTNRNWLLISKKFSACVRPGVEDVRARPRTASRELIKLDLPTFERPKKAISGFASRGQSASLKALLRNSAVTTFMILCGPLRISAFSALKTAFNAE